ncbi:MAG: CvpA family protein [Chloroflexi bacterium]|nr:CvpA family protein [Chloroflexota bacterium]MXZ63922.1 CvpA family protein [Chloroflexota bacterium]
MHWLDLVVVAVISWLTYRAFTVGLIREVVTTAALILGAILAGQFYAELSDDIAFAVEDETWRDFVAFASIFIGVVVIGQIGAMLLRRAAAVLLLGWADRIGGAAFGFAQGFLLVEVALFAILTFPISSELDAAVEASLLAPIFLDTLPVLLGLLPPEFESAVEMLSSTAA